MEILNSNEKICVKGLSKSFSGITILDDMSFSVHPGEFLSVLGSSGCGKSTLLRVLIGLLEPSAGSIYKDGVDITRRPPGKRSMGIVFQNFALFNNLTVLGNVQYALNSNGKSKAEAKKIALEIIEFVGLKEHVNKRPHKLSGGQQQRVAIARTLALNPEILLFDEPMSALDSDMRVMLCNELKRIQSVFGSTIIYVTHDQEEALTLSDRVMVMCGGKIQQIDTPANILLHPANDFVEQFIVHNIKYKADSIQRLGQII